MTNKASVQEHLVETSRRLYLFFGGIAGELAMPPFEFFNSSNVINENKIFFRDLDQCWYHAGLRGVTTDLLTTASFIKKQINRIKPDDVVFVGNSMGGFAALLFASIIGRGSAIAFAPPTFIHPELRARFGDARWRPHIARTLAVSCDFKAYDLRPFLLSKKQGQRMDIYYAADDPLDKVHALYLKGIEGITAHEVDAGGHGMVKQLRDRNLLAGILAGGAKA